MLPMYSPSFASACAHGARNAAQNSAPLHGTATCPLALRTGILRPSGHTHVFSVYGPFSLPTQSAKLSRSSFACCGDSSGARNASLRAATQTSANTAAPIRGSFGRISILMFVGSLTSLRRHRPCPRATETSQRRRVGAIRRLAALLLLLPAVARGDAAAARAYVASIRPSPELQAFLDRTVDAALAADPALRRAGLRVALLDLSRGGPPLLAERRGTAPVYPASVVKFVYLMAAYHWREQGELSIDPGLDGQIDEMIRV